MTKLFLFFLAVLAVAVAMIYVAIPSKIIFANVVYLNTGKSSAQRYLTDDRNWTKWWPGEALEDEKAKTDILHVYDSYTYSADKNMQDGLAISIRHGEHVVSTIMYLVQLNIDSVAVDWRGEMPQTNNPFKRLLNYRYAHDLKKNMAGVLQSAKSFLNDGEKIYGVKILHEMVKDTVLISSKKFFASYPTTNAVYDMISNLERYVNDKQGTITNYPMLHVNEDSGGFMTMVALPLRNEIPENSNFRTKRMVAGKILAAEVMGGKFKSKEVIRRIELYMDDLNIKSPAIHFESLVTNRLKEPDTLKWMTKVYYPVY